MANVKLCKFGDLNLMTTIPPQPFIVVDGSSYLFRAYYALPPLSTKTGQPTGAIYGVINMLRKLIAQYQPKQMAVVFDSKEKTFRHQAYAEYKANRAVMPDDLAAQIEPLQQIITAMGIPLIVIPGIEADDIIGTLAQQASSASKFTLVSTGDKDLAQLVNDKILLINTMTDTILDRAGVIEKFEVPPELIVDYLTLIGDSIDNIPGVPKVGPKTAVKWLAEYGSLQGVIDHAAQISGKVGENLRATLDKLPLYKNLITIQTDVEIGQKLEQLALTAGDPTTLQRLFTELEFKRWRQDLAATTQSESNADSSRGAVGAVSRAPALSATKNFANAPGVYRTILTEQEFGNFIQEIQRSKVFVLDTETTSLNYLQAELVGLALSIQPGSGIYVPVAHTYLGVPEQLQRSWVLAQLQPLLIDPNITLIGHNLKYDLGVLAKYDLQVTAKLYDTMLASYVLNSTGSRHDMDSLAQRHLNYKTITYTEVAGKGAKQKLFSAVELAAATNYAAEDADITFRLYQEFSAELAAIPALDKVLTTIELPLLPVILRMERHGVMIDPEQLHKLSKKLGKRVAQIEQEIYAAADHEFNINSPKQLQEVLFGKLGLPVLEKTATGQASTAEAVLEELALEYDLPKMILEYRSLSKLKSTYTDSLPQQINPHTKRIHTSYNQTVTATGRLSSTEPNLQNIPVRGEMGKKIRAAFVAPLGYKLLSADYSQIELRIMAHLSADLGLINAFKHKQDIHKITAAEVFSVKLDQVSEEQRRHAKAINFGLIYGMSAFGLAKQLTISREEADLYINSYFKKFPNVKKYMNETRELAARKGYVETLFGRRLYLPDINSKNMVRRRAAERAAINAPMQGGQADIIKLAMINIQNWIDSTKVDVKMIMQVHDELIFEVAEAELDLAIKQITTLMSSVIKLKVDLEVGVGIGANWDEAH